MMRRLHGQRGTTLPETAIIVGVLLALVFGIFEFGRALYTYNLVADMARKGARWAIVRGSLCTRLDSCPTDGPGILAYVKTQNGGGLDSSQITIDGGTTGGSYGSPIWPGTDATGNSCGNAGQGTGGGNNASGCNVVVTVHYPFNFMMPFMPSRSGACSGGGSGNICISSTSKMNIAQ